MQPIKRTMVLEPGEVNDNKIPVEPLHCPFVEHLAPMRGVSVDGQICAAEGAEDAQIEDLPQVSVQSIGQVDPKAPRWTQRVLSGPAIGYAGHREVFFITP